MRVLITTSCNRWISSYRSNFKQHLNFPTLVTNRVTSHWLLVFFKRDFFCFAKKLKNLLFKAEMKAALKSAMKNTWSPLCCSTSSPRHIRVLPAIDKPWPVFAYFRIRRLEQSLHCSCWLRSWLSACRPRPDNNDSRLNKLVMALLDLFLVIGVRD